MNQKYVASKTMTYSKQTKRYVEGVYPEYIESGRGAYVYDNKGNQLIDYIGALGANLLGYAHPLVNERLKNRIDGGTIFSFPSQLEGELANKLNSIYPYMEKMRFLKSGSEAVSAGVKIARAYTKRDVIVNIGYHGWHDWSSASSPKNSGSPSCLRKRCINMTYNDFAGLIDLFKMEGDAIAAIVMEPYIFENPGKDYLHNVVNLAHKNGALVLFDEVVTGVRWKDWGVSNYYEVEPDLFALGKPLGNGVPISVIGGKSEIMDVLDGDCFVSTTFGGDLLGIVGALATIEVCEQEDVQNKIYESGEDIKLSFNESANHLAIDASCYGNPARLGFKFPSEAHRALFWQESLLRGVMFGYATHTTLAHNSHIISQTIDVIRDSLKVVKLNWKDPLKALKGKLPELVEVVGARR